MKYRFDFGSEVISVPGRAAKYIASASREKLAVLLSLACDPSASDKKRAQALAISKKELTDAYEYWLDLGVISEAKISEAADFVGNKADDRGAKKASAEKPAALDDSSPHLTKRELTHSLSDEDNARLIEYCQQLMGRVFNAAEAERIVSVRSYLGVSADFIAAICKMLKKEGKLTVRSVENLAIKLHDEGIADNDALYDYIARREKALSYENEVRKLFGIGERNFTSAERKMLEKWASFGIDTEMIGFACELTVAKTDDASLKYANAIIESWGAAGIKTVADAKKQEEEFKSKTSRAKKKKTDEKAASSFDTDDFFEIALRRSYGDEFYENYKNGEAQNGSKTDDK